MDLRARKGSYPVELSAETGTETGVKPERRALHQSLVHHRVGDFDEAGDVGALDVVDVAVFFGAVFQAKTVESFTFGSLSRGSDISK